MAARVRRAFQPQGPLDESGRTFDGHYEGNRDPVEDRQRRRHQAAGFTANPSSEITATGFPAVQMMEGNIPAALALPNTNVQAILAAEQAGTPRAAGGDGFQ